MTEIRLYGSTTQQLRQLADAVEGVRDGVGWIDTCLPSPPCPSDNEDYAAGFEDGWDQAMEEFAIPPSAAAAADELAVVADALRMLANDIDDAKAKGRGAA